MANTSPIASIAIKKFFFILSFLAVLMSRRQLFIFAGLKPDA
jgi:hypothetical protein